MGLDATEVSIAVSGAISKVSDSTVITSALSDISGAGTVNYGYANADGVTVSTDRSTNKIVAWQNSAVVRTSATEATVNYKFTLLQNTKAARELYYGSAEDTNGKIAWNPAKMPRGRFVIDAIDSEYEGDDSGILYIRHDIKRGQISEVGDMVFKNGEPIGFEVTITAYPDSNGVVADVYNGNGNATPTNPGGTIPQITLNATNSTIAAGESIDVTGQVSNSPASTVKVVVTAPDLTTVEETVTLMLNGSFNYSYMTPGAQESMGSWVVTASTLPLGAESVQAQVTVTATM